MNLTYEVKSENEKIDVWLNGEIDVYTAPKLREALESFSERNGAQITIHLSDVGYMDSTGLGVIVGIYKNLKTHDGHLRLTGLSKRLKRLFDITGLADIMDVRSEIEGGV
ncbi:anti-sigma factor antagonist [Oikeobacillus pervagus]|nr:anti-sigma factor antagonist [Oikeobacillus pervagus]